MERVLRQVVVSGSGLGEWSPTSNDLVPGGDLRRPPTTWHLEAGEWWRAPGVRTLE